MTPPKSEKTVLRAELRRVWGVVEILLGVLAGSVRMTGNALKVIIDEMVQLNEEKPCPEGNNQEDGAEDKNSRELESFPCRGNRVRS